MLSKLHSCFGVFAGNNKSGQQLFSRTQNSQILLTLIMRGRINSFSNPSDYYTDDTKIYFKIIFILQLCIVKYIVSPSFYKTCRKKSFYVNINFCKSLFRNFITIAIRSRIPFHFMKLVVSLMMFQLCFKLSSLKHKELAPVVYLKIYSRVFGLKHVILKWKIIDAAQA